MQLPPQLLTSLQSINSFDQKAFEAVHASGEQITSIRFNPQKKITIENKFETAAATQTPELISQNPVSWSSNGYYLTHRPSFTLFR